MAADEALNALSLTDASNSPAGSATIGTTLDDEIRSVKANIARSGRWEVTATISAAATLPVTALHKCHPMSGSAAGTTTITLPTVANAGDGFAIKAFKTDATNDVIIDGNGAETIDGAATLTMMTQFEMVTLFCDGTQWYSDNIAAGASTTFTKLTSESTLSVSGAAVMKAALLAEDTLTVSGAAVMKSSLLAESTFTAVGAAVMKAALLAEDTLTVSGAAVMLTTLGVTGAATLSDTLTVSGAASFLTTVTAVGASVFKAGVTIEGTLTSSATAVFKSKISVSATASVGALTIAGVAFSSGSGAWEHVDAQSPVTMTVVGAVDFTTAAGYDYKVVFRDIAHVNDGTILYLRTSDDAAVSFEAAAGDYEGSYHFTVAGSAFTSQSTTSGAGVHMGIQGNATGENLRGEVIIYDPNNVANHTTVVGQTSGIHTDGLQKTTWIAFHRDAKEANDAIRLLPQTGNFKAEGTMELWRREIKT